MKTKRQKETFKTTPEIAELLQVVIQLEKAKNHVMKPVGFLFKRYDGKAVAEVSEAFAKARMRLWETIYQVYPETKEGKWNCNSDLISKL